MLERWKNLLRSLLAVYEKYRARIRYFPLKLFAYFLLLNAFCYWFGIATAFPYLLDEKPLHLFKVQIPVSLLGALFDVISFYVTLALMRQALKAKSIAAYLSHLSVDFGLAVAGSAWGLFIFIFSSWLVSLTEPVLPAVVTNPPVVEENIIAQPVVVDATTTKRPEKKPEEKPPTEPVTVASATTTASTPLDASLNATDKWFARQDVYTGAIIKALENPWANLRNIYFGIVMGFSTLIPILLHLFLAARAVLRT